MLWLLKRMVSRRRFFWEHKTHVFSDGLENNHNFTLKNVLNWPYVKLALFNVISYLNIFTEDRRKT